MIWALLLLFSTAAYAETAAPSPEQAFRDAYTVFEEESAAFLAKSRERKLTEIGNFFEHREKNLQEEIAADNLALELELLRFIKERPQHAYTPYARFQLGTLYFQLGEKQPYYYSAAEVQFAALEKLHSEFKFKEETLYLLAYSRLAQEKETEAVADFNRLSKQYPQSRFIEEASLRLGEHYFHKGAYAQSIPYYQRVLRKTDSPLFYKAHYKLAWVNYLTGQYDTALRSFLFIVVQGEQNEFYAESRDYAVYSLYKMRAGAAAVDRVAAASVRRQLDDVGYTICMRYGETLEENGDHNAAYALYLRLNHDYPNRPEAAETLYLASVALARQGQRERAVELQRRYLERYPEANDTRKRALFGIASYHYQEWINRRLPAASLNIARRNFDEISRDYPDSRESYDARYYGAEASYALQDYEQAAQDYQQVLLNPSYNQHFNDALQSIIVCHEKRLAGEKSRDKRDGIAKELLLALDDMLKRGKDDADKSRYTLKSAQVLFVLNRPDDAIERLEKLILKQPPAPNMAEATRELTGMLMSKSRWQEASDVSVNLLASGRFTADPKTTALLRQVDFDATVNLAKQFETRQQPLQAANRYLTLMNRSPDNIEIQKLALPAAKLYLDAGAETAAQQLLQRYAEKQTDPQARRDALLSIAAIQRDNLLFDDAAKTLTAVNAPQAKRLLADIEFLRDNNGVAANLYRDYAAVTTEPKARRESLQSAAALFERAKQPAAAEECYETLLRYGNDPSYYLGAARAKLALGSETQGRQLLVKAAALPKQQLQPYLSDLALLDGDLWSATFRKEPLYQRKAINPKKLTYLERAEARYLTAVQSKHPVNVSAALVKLATLYQSLSQDLMEGEDTAQGEKLHQKAVQIHQKNLADAYQSHRYNEWVLQSSEFLRASAATPKPMNDYRYIDADVFFVPPYLLDRSALPTTMLPGKKIPASQPIAQAYDLIENSPNDPRIADLLESSRAVASELPAVLYNLSLYYLTHGNPLLALQTLQQLPRQPRLAEARFLRASISASLEKWDEAAALYEALLRDFPETVALQIDLATIYAKQQRYRQSLAMAQEVLLKSAGSARLWRLISADLFALQQRQAAEASLNNALQRHPNDPLLTAELWRQALEKREFAALPPSTSDAKAVANYVLLNNFGILYYVMGDFVAAEQQFDLALKERGSQAQLYYNVALAQLAQGKRNEATDAYRRYLQLGGKGGKLAEVLKL